MDKYILKGREAVPASLQEWAQWYETAREDRRVARTELADGVIVSTVFLGLNHAWDDGPPLLFETLVFNGPHDGDMERCSTWEQAEAQHAAMVARLSN